MLKSTCLFNFSRWLPHRIKNYLRPWIAKHTTSKDRWQRTAIVRKYSLPPRLAVQALIKNHFQIMLTDFLTWINLLQELIKKEIKTSVHKSSLKSLTLRPNSSESLYWTCTLLAQHIRIIYGSFTFSTARI